MKRDCFPECFQGYREECWGEDMLVAGQFSVHKEFSKTVSFLLSSLDIENSENT